MENNNIKNGNHTNRIWSGLIILVIGIVFFLRNFGLNIPHWVINWPMLLIVIGLYKGTRRNFNGGGWLIMILVGGYFTLEDMGNFDFGKYYFAIVFIILGLYLILKPRKKASYYIFNDDDSSLIDSPVMSDDDNDVIDSLNIFGGSQQKIYAKNLKGGEVVAVFGGCELNLMQADFQNTIVIDVVAIFGGVKIIIPSTWQVKSEVTAIFGGMDDKRITAPFEGSTRKILVIKGVALFGGVDIRSF